MRETWRVEWTFDGPWNTVMRFRDLSLKKALRAVQQQRQQDAQHHMSFQYRLVRESDARVVMLP